MDSDGNMHCFLLPLSSCYIEISAVSQCRILWLFSIRKHSCLHFFFRLTPCTLLDSRDCIWLLSAYCDLVTIDTDWCRLNLLADSRCTSQKTQTQMWNWLRYETDSDSFHTVHSLSTAYKQYPAGCWWWWINYGAEQLQPQQLSHNNTMHKTCYLQDFKKLPNQNSIDRCNIEGFICCKLKSINKCISQ